VGRSTSRIVSGCGVPGACVKGAIASNPVSTNTDKCLLGLIRRVQPRVARYGLVFQMLYRVVFWLGGGIVGSGSVGFPFCGKGCKAPPCQPHVVQTLGSKVSFGGNPFCSGFPRLIAGGSCQRSGLAATWLGAGIVNLAENKIGRVHRLLILSLVFSGMPLCMSSLCPRGAPPSVWSNGCQ